MKFPLVISYFTENTPYEKEAAALKESCKQFDLSCLIQPVPSFGSWELNCCFKPGFILHIMKNLKQDVFWVDADALFVQKPLGFSKNIDMAARVQEDLPEKDPSRVLSGSIFFRYTQPVLDLLEKWSKECETALLTEQDRDEVWDQACLRNVLCDPSLKIIFTPLPIGYCVIADHDKLQKKDQYIVHYQASRLYKKWANDELVEFSEIKNLSPEELKQLRGF